MLKVFVIEDGVEEGKVSAAVDRYIRICLASHTTDEDDNDWRR